MDKGDVPEGTNGPEPEEHLAPPATEPTDALVNPAAVQPFSALLRQVEAVAGIPAYTRSDAEARFAVAKVSEIKSVLDSLSLRLLADLDARPDAIPGSQPDFVGRTYLRHVLNRTHGQAKLEVECAHRLIADADPLTGGLPLLGQALATGQISRDHVNVAVRAAMRLRPDQLAELRPRAALDDLMSASAEETGPTQPADRGEERATIPTGYALDAILTAQARILDSAQLERFARRLLNALTGDDGDGFDPGAVDRRFVHHSQDAATGMVVGRFQLDAENGAWFEAAMEQFTRRDEAREETTLDGDGTVVTPVRTPGQARADALGDICRAALASEQAGTAPGNERPRIVVTTGIETLRDALAGPSAHAESDSGSGAHPNRRPARTEHFGLIGRCLLGTLACDSILQQAVFGPSGAALSLGREVRTVSKAQRRILNARDRGCVMPGCAAPARRCQAHHVTWWRRGGDTDVGNLALVCASCHTQIHLGSWDLVMVKGVPWARPPAYVDPARRLIRNTFHDALDRAGTLSRQRPDGGTGPPEEARRVPGGRSGWEGPVEEDPDRQEGRRQGNQDDREPRHEPPEVRRPGGQKQEDEQPPWGQDEPELQLGRVQKHGEGQDDIGQDQAGQDQAGHP